MLFPIYFDKHFIKISLIVQSTLFVSQGFCKGRRKLQAPLTYSFIGNNDASISQHFFNVPETQSESMVKPYNIDDNRLWVTIAFIRIHT